MDTAGRATGLICACVTALWLSACAVPSDEDLYVIRFPHVTAPETPKGQAAQMFSDLAAERFPQRVRVEVYPSAQLMGDSDSLEALAFGDIQMVAAPLSLFDRLTDRLQVFDLPYLFISLDAVERFQQSPVGFALLDVLQDRGIRGLAYWHNGMKQFSAPRPLYTPDDAAGLKFRIMESDVLQSQVQAFGGNPQKMAFAEVYQALQTGTVDAQENTWSNIYSSRFYEVQPFITETNHGYIGYMVAVNDEFWQSLPEDIRIGLTEILAEVTAWGNANASRINNEHRELIENSGRSTIVTLTPAQKMAWGRTLGLVWFQYQSQIGKELLFAAMMANWPVPER
jgi:C4-dicarboxylate-binding protein DctP